MGSPEQYIAVSPISNSDRPKKKRDKTRNNTTSCKAKDLQKLKSRVERKFRRH